MIIKGPPKETNVDCAWAEASDLLSQAVFRSSGDQQMFPQYHWYRSIAMVVCIYHYNQVLGLYDRVRRNTHYPGLNPCTYKIRVCNPSTIERAFFCMWLLLPLYFPNSWHMSQKQTWIYRLSKCHIWIAVLLLFQRLNFHPGFSVNFPTPTMIAANG